MRPNYTSLSNLFYKYIIATDVNKKAVTREISVSSPSQIQSPMQIINDHHGNVDLRSASGGFQQGFWVHYEADKATYGVAKPGQMWAASGPFSGCHISIGLKNGEMYVGHIAKPGKGPEAQWGKKGKSFTEWSRFKVGLDKQKNDFHSSIIFVDWFKGKKPKDIQITRVEYKSKGMGGIDAEPMLVREVTQIPLLLASKWK